MNYPVTFYHNDHLPRLTCTKFRHSRRNIYWPCGLGTRLLGHATISLSGNGTVAQVAYLEDKVNKRLVVVPDKNLQDWDRIERGWHGDVNIFYVTRLAIEAYLAGNGPGNGSEGA